MLLKDFFPPRKSKTVFSDEVARIKLCNIFGGGINCFHVVLCVDVLDDCLDAFDLDNPFAFVRKLLVPQVL